MGPGRKPRRPVFSQRDSFWNHDDLSIVMKCKLGYQDSFGPRQFCKGQYICKSNKKERKTEKEVGRQEFGETARGVEGRVERRRIVETPYVIAEI